MAARAERPGVRALVRLELKKEEGRVRASESDDGVSWRLVTSVVLTLANPYGMGMATVSVDDAATVRLDSVLVSQQPNDPNVLFEQMTTFGAEVIDGKHRGGDIIIPNPSFDPCTAKSGFCNYATSIYRGALNRAADATLRVTANRQTTFSGQEAVGNEVSAELPLEALTLNKSTTVLVLFAPTFPDAYEANLGFIAAEVQISFDGVLAHRYLRSYGLGAPLFIYAGNIISAMRKTGAGQVGTMRISVLPISSKTR
jgi:hypothetical protein